MHRTLITILLFFSISWQMFVKLGIMVYYECNKNYIAANLCENRNKPELKCCGKCYLKKQLVKADKSTQSPTEKQLPSKWNLGEHFVYLLPSPIVISPLYYEQILEHHSKLRSLPLHSFSQSVFHPPLQHLA